MRIKYRITFSKSGPARFLGHLDLQTLFQRSIKRGGLPVAYSQGFNPHQLISFAQPLALGMEGKAELVDVEMTDELEENQILQKLNAVLPEGFYCCQAELLPENAKSSAALMLQADYVCTFPPGCFSLEKLNVIIQDILNADEIRIEKKQKKGKGSPESVNIRPDIFGLTSLASEDGAQMKMRLSAGSARNLKPEVVARLVLEKAGLEIPGYRIKYCREKLILDESYRRPQNDK